MKILFWGTPQYAVPTLDALHLAGHTILGVVTQPDRRRGRGKQLIPSPVKERALALGCPVLTPDRVRHDQAMQACLADLGAEISVVVAFGQILPKAVLEQPPFGCWNGHGSLLPRWRGAGPIQWSLLEGDTQTGVGVMAMEEGLDTGPVLLQRAIQIGLLENAQVLALRLSQLTAELMVEALPRIENAGTGPTTERLSRLCVQRQEDMADEPSYARMLQKDDFKVDWNESALVIHRTVMGLYPNAVCRWQGKRLKLLETEPLVERLHGQLSPSTRELIGRWSTGGDPPGTVLCCHNPEGIVISTKGCPLLLRTAQLEGKKATRGIALRQQLGAQPGMVLETDH